MADPTNSNSAIISIASSALQAQQQRMRIIAENIANSDSMAKDANGDPYRRQAVVFEPTTVDGGGQGVKVSQVMPDQTPFKQDYEPGNPAADKNGYVKLPNVEPLVEALDMKEAQRAYEANLNVIDTAREMQTSTLGLLKQ
jgi:flagellar basal-body rod protein FlgC